MDKRVCTSLSMKCSSKVYWYIPICLAKYFDQGMYYIPVHTGMYQFGLSQYNMVHTGTYQNEIFKFVYKLVCTRMRTFQVKFILVHESTSPVDLVYTQLGRAGSRKSRRITAAKRHAKSIRKPIYCLSAADALVQRPRPAGAGLACCLANDAASSAAAGASAPAGTGSAADVASFSASAEE
jgi:hypothetical protein